MTDEHREAVGLLCRWCLLGLAWAGLAAGGYVGALAASPRQETPRAFLSDEVFLVTLHPWIVARLVPPPKDAADVHLLVCCGDRVSIAAFSESEPFYLPIDRPGPRDVRTRVLGMPYVFLMFGGDGGKVRLVPRDDRVFLIDSLLETSAGGSDPDLWARARAALRRRGSVALLHPGPARAFEAYRRDLRRRGIGDPVICALTAGKAAVASLADARNTLRAKGRRADLTTVITGRHELAQAAARMGFSSIWIVPRGAPLPGGDARVKAYASLEGFVRSAEAEPAGR